MVNPHHLVRYKVFSITSGEKEDDWRYIIIHSTDQFWLGYRVNTSAEDLGEEYLVRRGLHVPHGPVVL